VPKLLLSRQEVAEFVDRVLAQSRATLVRDFRGALGRYAAASGGGSAVVTRDPRRTVLVTMSDSAEILAVPSRMIEAAERDGCALGTPGLVSIVTDGFGHALCAIRIERVEQLRFCDVSPAHAWIEGEGDRTLDDWRAGHLRYFSAEAARLGLVFSEDARVNFEHFTLIAVFGRIDG
jgi:uncharacterized protein YhfF